MVHIEDIDDLKKKIKNKLKGYRTTDAKKIDFYPTINKGKKSIKMLDAIKLVKELDSDICKGCGCIMLFTGYKPFCVYQFSFDRINNKIIHAIDNLNIVCYNCNSIGYDMLKDACKSGCHQRIYPILE